VAPAGVAVAVVPAGAAVAVVPVPDGGDAAAPVAAPVAVVAVPASSGATPGASSDSSSDSPSHAPAYVAFAVGAAGIGMTVAFGILALQNKSTLSGECTSGNACPSSASSTVSSLSTNGDLADVGLGIAVAGAILFATEHKSSATTGKRHVEPWIGLGAGGFKGTF
jgi:hypothetical protein